MQLTRRGGSGVPDPWRVLADDLGKIRELSGMIAAQGLDTPVEVDGGINAATAADAVAAGARILVAGAAVFKAENCAKAVAAIRAAGMKRRPEYA